ncbi:TPA: GNAT family N-acetyltransferase [Bacillus luti]|nr:GNAT family N-acetyltransferase [Bacillus luti]
MKIYIEQLEKHDAKDLFTFELTNTYFYLIRNNKKEIVGRINLVDIDTETRISSLGYRVGEKFTKKGVATAAVKLILDVAKNNKINEVHAKTTSNNLASQIVLEKSGFSSYQNEADTTSVKLNGEHVNFVHYIWRNISHSNK